VWGWRCAPVQKRLGKRAAKIYRVSASAPTSDDRRPTPRANKIASEKKLINYRMSNHLTGGPPATLVPTYPAKVMAKVTSLGFLLRQISTSDRTHARFGFLLHIPLRAVLSGRESRRSTQVCHSGGRSWSATREWPWRMRSQSTEAEDSGQYRMAHVVWWRP